MNDVEEYLLSIIRPMLKPGAYKDLHVKTKDGRISYAYTGESHEVPENIRKKK